MTTSDTKPHWIIFVAEYKDGTKDYFQIDPDKLEHGDHVSRIVAREWQVEGKLKKGEINRVYRYWAAMGKPSTGSFGSPWPFCRSAMSLPGRR